MTQASVTKLSLRTFRIGTTLPSGSRAASVKLDGKRVHATLRTTNRGVEVSVRAPAKGSHTLTLTSR
jgi:hypothetical protein